MTQLSVIREIDPSARVAPTAVIGQFCVIGPNVTVGPGTVLQRRVTVSGYTTIGSGNIFGEGCVLGAEPQDLKYAGGRTLLVIGHRNRFERCVTAHIGTETGGYVTRIGDDNALMEGCHIAHDCFVDDRTRLGRGVQLAGHIRICSGAVLEDMSAVHHFVTIGRYARVGRSTPVRRDVPPYTYFASADGEAPAVRGLHEEGIRQAALPPPDEKELRDALQELFGDERALQTKIELLVNQGVEGEAAGLCEFCHLSLQGIYGRHRELFRGRIPPEALPYLPPEYR